MKHLRKPPAQPQTPAQDARTAAKVRASHPYAPPYEQCEKFYRNHLDKVRRRVIVVIEQTDNKEEYCAAGRFRRLFLENRRRKA